MTSKNVGNNEEIIHAIRRETYPVLRENRTNPEQGTSQITDRPTFCKRVMYRPQNRTIKSQYLLTLVPSIMILAKGLSETTFLVEILRARK